MHAVDGQGSNTSYPNDDDDDDDDGDDELNTTIRFSDAGRPRLP